MGQKINPNLFNFVEKNNQQSKYFEKKLTDFSVYSKTDLDIKKFCKTFFISKSVIINNCNVFYNINVLNIYIAYYQKVNNNHIVFDKNQKNKLIKNLLNTQQFQQQLMIRKKSIHKNLHFIKLRQIKHYPKMNSFLETILFLECFFKSLTKFIKKKYNIFLTLRRQNTEVIVFKQKQIKEKNTVFIQRKQKLVNLRKYKQSFFFKDSLNILFSCIKNKNSSKLMAQFIAIQLKALKQHNFFIRFIKNTLNVFNNKMFFSIVKGIKIQIKGRLNGNSRSNIKTITSAKVLPLLKKNLNINYFEETSFTLNGTFGIKV